MSTKAIRFRGIIKSSGIVNFDGKGAKWLLKKAKPDNISQLSHDNVKVAKHAITQTTNKDGDPVLNAVLKISKDCIRQGIFNEDQPNHNPGIVHAQKLFIKLLASAAGLLRGYMFADQGIKRKSPVYISDAVQISNNVSTFDIGTLNAPKDQKETADDVSGLTMHYKESIGGIVSYEFEGAIDLTELQFISLSEVYDRKAMNVNYIDEYLAELKKVLGSAVPGKKFYIKKTAVNGLPEEGILLTSDQTKFLVGEFFKRLIDIEIMRGASGRAWLDKLEVLPKSNGLSNGNWTHVSDEETVVKLIKSVDTAYTEYNEDEAAKLYETIDTGKKRQASEKASKKSSKKTSEKAKAEED
jgi:hypothetical protein